MNINNILHIFFPFLKNNFSITIASIINLLIKLIFIIIIIILYNRIQKIYNEKKTIITTIQNIENNVDDLAEALFKEYSEQIINILENNLIFGIINIAKLNSKNLLNPFLLYFKKLGYKQLHKIAQCEATKNNIQNLIFLKCYENKTLLQDKFLLSQNLNITNNINENLSPQNQYQKKLDKAYNYKNQTYNIVLLEILISNDNDKNENLFINFINFVMNEIILTQSTNELLHNQTIYNFIKKLNELFNNEIKFECFKDKNTEKTIFNFGNTLNKEIKQLYFIANSDFINTKFYKFNKNNLFYFIFFFTICNFISIIIYYYNYYNSKISFYEYKKNNCLFIIFIIFIINIYLITIDIHFYFKKQLLNELFKEKNLFIDIN